MNGLVAAPARSIGCTAALSSDGLSNCTPHTAAGNGVLFHASDNTGVATDKRQYVFSEWDPTATIDMEALVAEHSLSIRFLAGCGVPDQFNLSRCHLGALQ